MTRVQCHRYEKGEVGGRLKSLKFGDKPYELGGSMVYHDNLYIRSLPVLAPHLVALSGARAWPLH